MNQSRRNFVATLAAIPLVGPFLSRGAAHGTEEPVYGFDERVGLAEMFGDRFRFVADENLWRGDLVSLTTSSLFEHSLYGVRRATPNDYPIGMVIQPVSANEEVGSAVLVMLVNGTLGTGIWGARL